MAAEACAPPIQAVVSYTGHPSEGKRAGRLVDAERWAKLRQALATSEFDEHDKLMDDDIAKQVEVHDARRILPAPTLDTMGFELRPSPSSITEWLRTPETIAAACAEAEDLVRKALPGAKDLVAFDNTWRSSLRSNFDSSVGGSSPFSSAVARVHTDFTSTSALEKVKQLVEQDKIGAHFADGSRFRRAIVNVWRAYGGGECCTSAPLAVIDPATVVDSSCFPYALVHEKQAGINGSISFHESHKWYFFPQMRPDETLLFYNFEEGIDGNASRSVYHAALDAASAQHELPPGRLSVEVRVLVLFER